MEARRQPQKGAEGEYFLNPHNRQGSRLVPGGHTRAWGRFSHASPLTHRDACRPQGLDPPWGSSVGTGPRSLSWAPVGPEPCFMLHPSRPISNDSRLPICMGICIVSLTLFHQARLPIPEPGPPRKPRHLGTPNGAVGTSGFQSYPSPPESIPELSPSPCQGAIQSSHPMGSSTHVRQDGAGEVPL